jgi:hypothetical protein
MAEARGREMWGHTSTVLAMIANCNRDPKKSRAFNPADFNPYAAKRRRGIPITAGNIDILRRIFVTADGAGTAKQAGSARI